MPFFFLKKKNKDGNDHHPKHEPIDALVPSAACGGAASTSTSSPSCPAPSHATNTSYEHHRDDNIILSVEQPPDGFWVSIRLLARVPLPPEEVFAILTDPNNHRYFRSIKSMKNRKLIQSDGHGKQLVEVEQVGRWRFGLFSGTFSVKLAVSEDKKQHAVGFRLLPRPHSFMRDFSGQWKVQPYNIDTYDQLVAHPLDHQKHAWSPWHSMRNAIHQLEDTLTGKHANSSLVELRQCVAPAILPPPPLDKILKKITVAQVKTVMVDLLAEAKKRNNSSGKGDDEEQRRLEYHITRKL